MTAPLFVKGGVPVVYTTQHQKDQGTLGLRVWMPRTEPTDCTGGHSPASAARADAGAAGGGLAWSGVYDDDGETTRYKTHGEHWRARAGFAATLCAAGTGTGTGGSLSLRFAVLHSSYAAAHKRAEWVVHELATAAAAVDCASSEGRSAGAGEVAWSHSVEHQELRVTAPLGHTCTVLLKAA